MAIQLNSDATTFRRTANLPPGTSFTLCGWFKWDTVTPARFWGPMCVSDAVSGTAYCGLASTTSGGAQLALTYSNASAVEVQVALLTVSAATWYFCAITRSGVATGNAIAYIRALRDKTFTSVASSSTANALTPGNVDFGRDGFTGEFMDGSAQTLCMFDRVLTSRELLVLSDALLREQIPDRTNLNVYYRLRGNSDYFDLSPNRRDATVTLGINKQGIRIWPRQAPLVLSNPSTAITGTLAKTLAALVSSGSGAVDVAGSGAQTLTALTSVGAGGVKVDGSLAQTLGAVTSAGVGSVGSNVDGSLAQTLGVLTSAGAGAVKVDGAAAVTLGAVTAVGAGAVNVDGTLAQTLAPLTSVGVGDNGSAATPSQGMNLPLRRRRV